MKEIESKFNPDLKLIGRIEIILKALLMEKYEKKVLRRFLGLQERFQLLYNYDDGLIMSPINIIKCINEYINAGILISDIGYYRHHTIIFSAPETHRSFFTDSGLSSFGSGLPSAAAAKLIDKDRRVVLVCGDGGFHSGSCDLETLVRNKIHIIIVILNNSSFELIKLYQKQGKPDISNQNILNFSKVDFALIAEANGCTGVKVNSIEHLKNILENYNDDCTLVLDVPFKYSEQDTFKESF
ncbi:MAG: thiamine pyrophosphate-binding protein [Chitinophagaceae bacterium]|nr:thiamine pyrophosphate-binding protein [Chitinophagaceae bacterium]